MRSENSIVLEVDVTTVRRLLQTRAVNLEVMHTVDSEGKRRLHGLMLEVLKRELSHLPD